MVKQIPEEGEIVEDPKLVGFCHVNIGFDESENVTGPPPAPPKKKGSRRGSMVSFNEPEERRNSNASNGIDKIDSTSFNEARSIHNLSSIEDDRCSTASIVSEQLEKETPKIQPRPKAAVIVRNAVKGYSKKGDPVLNNFSMTIQKGTIYSLLGASGCGKTTVLTCILGIKHLNSGEILVFNSKPGTKESGIPGKRVGYMPQDIALYNDFSIQETMQYYGAIYSMSRTDIKSSMDFLMSFLDLPDEARRVGTLSSGQKRRVSLAVSFIHSPELLILDEPTVGVDPLLRESIWNHLVNLVSEKKTTVIITTHYIEEARQSHMIGLMRHGRLLAEKDPAALMIEHNVNLLEDIVLKLCRKDKLGNYEEGFTSQKDELEKDDDQYDTNDLEEPYGNGRKTSEMRGRRRMSIFEMKTTEDYSEIKSSVNRIKALAKKNLVIMLRNFLLVLFMILCPAMNILVICTAVGNDPKQMTMGIVNHDTNYSDACLDSISSYTEGQCNVENLSCRFISKLPPDEVPLIEYETEDIAREAVKDGKVWGFLLFPEGYSDNVYVRAASGNIIDDDALKGSFITYQLDMSNKQISGPLKKVLFDAYEDFVKELLTDCGFNPTLAESPLKALEPIYGKDDTDFREFIAPSVLLGLLFFFPLCSSAISYIYDKKLGTLERARVAGVKTWEIMIAFFLTEGCVLLIQSTLTLTIISILFGIKIQGSPVLALGVTMSMGLGGVSMGFLIASFCNEEVEAVMLAMASFFPNFLLAGMLWPIEGMPVFIQYIAYLLPCTLAGDSMRSIVSRGWGFTHIKVWPGFLSSFSWIAVYWMATIYIHKVVLARK